MISVAYAALWIFVFAVPWEAVVVVPGLAVGTRLTGGLALGLALFAVVISGRFRRWGLFHVAAVLFVAWAGVGIWVLLGARGIPQKFYTFVQLLAMVWIIWELAPSRRRQLGLLMAYVLGVSVAALGTLMLYRSEAGELRRFAVAGADPNTHAMRLALAIPMAWYLGMTYQRPLLRWVCRAYLPLALLAIGLTGSRGGMLACIVSLLVVPMTMTLSPKRLATAVVMLALSGALAVAYVPDKVVQRLATTGSEVESARFGGRFKLWVAGVHAFAQRPVMGYGVSGFRPAIAPELGSATDVAHNSFLSVLVEEGLVGLLFYLLMLLSVYLAILRLPRLDRRFALVLFGTLITAMLPLTWEDQKTAWFIMAALFGMAKIQATGLSRAVPRPAGRAAPIGSPALAARETERLAAAGRPRGRDATA